MRNGVALPPDVEFVTIDAQGQRRTEAQCPQAVTLPFLVGSAPQAWASCGSQEPSEATSQTPATQKPRLNWFRRIFR